MEYKLVNSSNDDIDKLISYKLDIILCQAENLDQNEIKMIYKYVNDNVTKELFNYKSIVIKNETVGSLLAFKKKDSLLLDEIYIEEKYRNQNIGRDIIKDLILKNDIIYLWVYKKNKGAIKLYKKMGFKIIDKTENRFYMKYKKYNEENI